MGAPESHVSVERGLRCHDVTACYGALQVCRGVSLHVEPGEVLSLIGPNGAGKTSLIGALNGTVTSTGRIWLERQPLDGLASWRRVRAGLATVPDNRGLFPALTVGDNLRLGALLCGKSQSAALDEAVQLFPFLRSRWKDVAGALSGGQQQMLAVAKCLVGGPRALLLDEPTQGLAPIIVDELAEAIGNLRRRGLPILLVEQNHHLVEQVSDRFMVMVGGRIVLEGAGDELADRDRIVSLYLQHREDHGVQQPEEAR
ncbi:MAG: ABC transporter ATP-binding protein [Pseudomonadota bacterium]